MFKKLAVAAALGFAALLTSHSAPAQAWQKCSIPESILAKLAADFQSATSSVGGGFFNPKMMWIAVVDRDGRLCGTLKTGDAWPGSRAIAIAKASTANDFSNNKIALSTANLYGTTLPGGSLFGLNNSNPFNALLSDPKVNAQGTVPGGIITFGGGVPLYAGKTVIGGLGVSGDSACADHDVAWVTRRTAIAQGVVSAPPTNDNIVYASPVVPGTFTYPFCLGGEKPPSGDTRAAAHARAIMQ